jgi:hypothetical protein
MPTSRRRVLYVVIDRPEDATPASHAPNVDGVRAAASAFDPPLTVDVVTVADLCGKDVDATYAPFAIFGAGSFSEWFQYGADAKWRALLDEYMAFVRATSIPMLAVCGSHQLVAAAFNGWGAVAHMNDDGPPVMIADELAATPPHGLFPSPRVGEEGTYPVVAASGVDRDPFVLACGASVMTAVHHKDMVVDPNGYTLLYRGDPSRDAASSAGRQAQRRCVVHALRRDDPARLLVTTQFHPEMGGFAESTQDDAGFGARWLASFFAQASAWWDEQASAPP